MDNRTEKLDDDTMGELFGTLHKVKMNSGIDFAGYSVDLDTPMKAPDQPYRDYKPTIKRPHNQTSVDTSSNQNAALATVEPTNTDLLNPAKSAERPTFIIREAAAGPASPGTTTQANAPANDTSSSSNERIVKRRPPKPQNTFVGGIIRKKSVPYMHQMRSDLIQGKRYSHKENQSLVVTPADFTPYKKQAKKLIVEDSFDEDYAIRSRINNKMSSNASMEEISITDEARLHGLRRSPAREGSRTVEELHAGVGEHT